MSDAVAAEIMRMPMDRIEELSKILNDTSTPLTARKVTMRILGASADLVEWLSQDALT